MSSVRYQLQGMHCQSCVGKVSQVLHQFVKQANVSLQPPQAELIDSAQNLDSLDLGKINHALSLVGKYQMMVMARADIAPEQQDTVDSQKSWLKTYQPLLILFGYLLISSFLLQSSQTSFDWEKWMQHFMAMFFLVFSFFKLLDIGAFANSYAMYDLLAMRFKPYGYVYPFTELSLGLAYLTGVNLTMTNLVTFVVMGFSSLGVIQSVLRKQKIRCACLGAVFNLPMSSVTIVEDVLMVAMAAWMLLQHGF